MQAAAGCGASQVGLLCYACLKWCWACYKLRGSVMRAVCICSHYAEVHLQAAQQDQQLSQTRFRAR